MLLEFLQYITTPCPPYVRHMGYLKEAIATKWRYKRCKTAWQSHLDASKNYILSALEQLEQKRSILVLGGGGGHDLPLAQLSKQCEKVYYVDIILLRNAKRTLSLFDNITYYSHDITETAATLYNEPNAALEVKQPTLFLDNAEIDLVISANLLSQLPYILVQWLRDKSTHNEADIHRFAQAIIQAHLDYLLAFNAPCCLITDHCSEVRDTDNTLIESLDLLYGVTLPEAEQNWKWDMAPLHEYSHEHLVIHHVNALMLDQNP